MRNWGWQFRISGRRSLALVAGLMTCWLTLYPVWGQTPVLPGSRTDANTISVTQAAEIATDEVSLDGYDLFAIAAPAVNDDNKLQIRITPIQQRVRSIEANLSRLANSSLDLKNLAIRKSLEPRSNLPIITVNDGYLMTVTTLDAQLHGSDPDRWADELIPILRNGLARAREERQPSYLARQGTLAAGLLVMVLLLSWGVERLQHRLKQQYDRLQAEIPAAPPVAPNIADTASPNTLLTVRQQMSGQRRRNLNEAQRRCLQLLQLSLWGGSLFFILGLFPYSRWLQPFILSAPLKILGFGLGIYVTIRFSDALIDRFLGALEAGDFIPAAASQRLALRASTFSQILKSLAAIAWSLVGIFTILSFIGVDLAPILAGAGIIGLAISFASQSLIKDMINGFLILLEDQYAVGDVVAIGSMAGLVESMNLRITQLRNAEGRLITIPNGTITTVENLSKDWSRVDLAVDVAHSANLDQAIAAIQQVAEDMDHDPAWDEKIVEPPEVLGIDKIDQSGVTVRVWIKTRPLEQWTVAREFRRRLKLSPALKEISISVPQQSFWFKSPLDLEDKAPSGERPSFFSPDNRK